MIKFLLILIVFSVSLFSGYEYIFADDIVPTITIQPTKGIYYIGDLIFVNGTVSDVNWVENTDIIYEIYHGGEIVESIIEPLNNDEIFSFVIDTTDIIWNDFSGFCFVTVTIQNVTESTIVFYYPNEIDMTNESLYERSMIHEERISSNNSTLSTHGIMFDEYNTRIYNNDIMVNEHSQKFISHDDRINNQTDTDISHQLQLDSLRNDLTVTAGFLANLNVTLTVDVPPILTNEALAEILYENQRHQDEIDQLNTNIVDTQIKLDKAILDENTNKIIKYEKNIASYEVSRAHSQAKLNMSNLLLLVYPQE